MSMQGNSFNQPLNTAVNSAPELTKSPGLAVGVAQAGGDVAGNSQAVAHATNVITDTNATQSLAQAVGGPGVVRGYAERSGSGACHTWDYAAGAPPVAAVAHRVLPAAVLSCRPWRL